MSTIILLANLMVHDSLFIQFPSRILFKIVGFYFIGWYIWNCEVIFADFKNLFKRFHENGSL